MSLSPGCAAAGEAPMSHRLFHYTMAGATLAVAGFSVWGVRAADIQVDLWQVLPLAGVAVFLLALAAFYRWREADKLVNVLLIVFWAVVFTNLHKFPMFIAARQPFPLQDELFVRIDRAIGLEVTDVLHWLETSPGLTLFLSVSYALLIPLMTAAIVAPPMVDRMSASKEYIIASMVAALISMPIFAVLPAIGPWTQYGYSASPAQRSCEQTLLGLKQPGAFLMDVTYADGLICFPSFHAILAILAGVALWPVPYLRWPAAVLASLITVSTLTTGWHYVIDVLAGLVVVVICVAAAKLFTRLEGAVARRARASHQAACPVIATPAGETATSPTPTSPAPG
ncbi:hypothetical protein AYO44_15945 [Planctomycetaceae bacterium SCGC AG-212-F19]|nr:hypothetical protein AYO44_15945 [Planctomycetaceae bacterium SCGC AG-212-F19]